jgi:hypothetical protein
MPATLTRRPTLEPIAVTVAKSLAGPFAASSRPEPTAVHEPRRSWIDMLDRWVWKRRQRHLDAWLARSVDRADLETRLKHLERATFNRYF